ncbi:MAG: protein phosphatase 2C domain-containing protein [Planctomycetota bacterium]|nr:protein phosphatase 2C domain-containing protein [Planctomycetota bacterium]
MEYRAFGLPRHGNTPAECEDTWAADQAGHRFAVADGATGSVFARDWARLLVDHFVAADCDADQWPQWLPQAQAGFIAKYRGRELPFYTMDKLQLGAEATFLGLVVSNLSGQWLAMAVGDSCLFHTCGNELRQAIPIQRSAEFGNHPRLVNSRMAWEKLQPPYAVPAWGTTQSGDRLWLMTDALANWCLAQHELHQEPWEALEQFLEPSATELDFSTWIEGLRDARLLRNDDVTLLAVKV